MKYAGHENEGNDQLGQNIFLFKHIFSTLCDNKSIEASEENMHVDTEL